jgi:hypothetical protein
MTQQYTMSQAKKIGLPGELRGIKAAADIFGWKEEDMLWYHYSQRDFYDIPQELRATIKAKMVYSWRKQKYDGIDFQHGTDTFDMKVNDRGKRGTPYTRFCFEVYRYTKTGLLYFRNSKARIIGQELTLNGYRGFYEKSIILDILNYWEIGDRFGEKFQLVPDPKGRTNCWLFFVDPELLDTLVFNWLLRTIKGKEKKSLATLT